MRRCIRSSSTAEMQGAVQQILLHGRQGVHRGNCRLDRKGGTHAGKPLAASSTRESRACGQQ